MPPINGDVAGWPVGRMGGVMRVREGGSATLPLPRASSGILQRAVRFMKWVFEKNTLYEPQLTAVTHHIWPMLGFCKIYESGLLHGYPQEEGRRGCLKREMVRNGSNNIIQIV